jgi:hypothetical protein
VSAGAVRLLPWLVAGSLAVVGLLFGAPLLALVLVETVLYLGYSVRVLQEELLSSVDSRPAEGEVPR